MSKQHEIVQFLSKKRKRLPSCLDIPEIVYPKHPTAELIKTLSFTWDDRGWLTVRCKRPTFVLSSDMHGYIDPDTGFGDIGWEHMRVAMLPFRNKFNS